MGRRDLTADMTVRQGWMAVIPCVPWGHSGLGSGGAAMSGLRTVSLQEPVEGSRLLAGRSFCVRLRVKRCTAFVTCQIRNAGSSILL